MFAANQCSRTQKVEDWARSIVLRGNWSAQGMSRNGAGARGVSPFRVSNLWLWTVSFGNERYSTTNYAHKIFTRPHWGIVVEDACGESAVAPLRFGTTSKNNNQLLRCSGFCWPGGLRQCKWTLPLVCDIYSTYLIVWCSLRHHQTVFSV